MARLRRFDLDELATRPGTYFNPETEILIVVDDSAHPGAELADDGRGPRVDPRRRRGPARRRSQRDELLERLEVRAARAGERDEVDDDEVVEEEESLEPDPDPDEYDEAA